MVWFGIAISDHRFVLYIAQESYLSDYAGFDIENIFDNLSSSRVQ